MSDNIFDRLFELFQSSGPVNWKLAAEIRKSLVGDPEPIDPALAEEYQSLEMAASLRLGDVPGLTVPSAAPLHPVDRVTWSTDNEQSYRYLVEPLATKFGGLGLETGALGPMGAVIGQMGPALLGMQAGSLVGYLARTVMGQFDVGMPALDHDQRYLIVPNVEAFAGAHRFDHQQVRMWAVANEIAHHAILDTPGLRAHLVSTVGAFYDTLEYDTSGLGDMMSGMEDPTQLQRLFGEGEGDGIGSLFGTTYDETALDRVRALFAFIEGYGRYVATGAVADLLPEGQRIVAAAATRRTEADDAAEALQQLTGLAIDGADALAATRLCEEIERRYGPEMFAEILSDLTKLPTLSELNDVVGWMARTQLD